MRGISWLQTVQTVLTMLTQTRTTGACQGRAPADDVIQLKDRCQPKAISISRDEEMIGPMDSDTQACIGSLRRASTLFADLDERVQNFILDDLAAYETKTAEAQRSSFAPMSRLK
jgi:hypothetical protein